MRVSDRKQADGKGAQKKLDAKGLHFGVVVSEFNRVITDELLANTLGALRESGAKNGQVQTQRVPGAFELPLAARKMAATGLYDSIVCIGCVVRGETTHYDYVASETARGIMLAQMDTGVPMIFCVLTCETQQQAIDRASPTGQNKGRESGRAAIEMARLSRNLSGSSRPR